MTKKQTEPHIYAETIGGMALVISLPIAIMWHFSNGNEEWRWMMLLITIGWALLPPLWFRWEYRWHVRNNSSEERIARLLRSQQMARTIWAGILVVMAAIYFHGVE